jgi:hypothetical protein
VGVRIVDLESLGWTFCESSRDRPTARRAALAMRAPPSAAFRVRVMQEFPPRLASLRHRKWQSAVFSRSSRVRYFYNPKHTTTRLRMAHVTCPECGEEVSQPSSTCSKYDAPPAKASLATTPQSVPAQRHKTHPVTWVVTAAIIPLLCWDAWQTYRSKAFKDAGGCEVRSRGTGVGPPAAIGRATAGPCAGGKGLDR